MRTDGGLGNALLRAMIAAEKEKNGGAAPPSVAVDVQARKLVDVLADVSKPCPFKVGDLVKQRPEYERYRWPLGEDLAIVVKVLDAPLIMGDSSEALTVADVIVLLLTDAGTWAQFYSESWRYAKYEGEVA